MTNHFNPQGMEGETVSLSQRELDIEAAVRRVGLDAIQFVDCALRFCKYCEFEARHVRAAFASIQSARAALTAKAANQPRDWHGRFVPSSKTARVHDALKRAVQG